MQSQRAQIQIIAVFLVVIVAIVLFATLYNPGKNETQETYSPGTISLPEQSQSSPGQTIPADDKDSPSLFNSQPSGDISADARKITMSLETDEKAVCKYSTISGVYYEYMQHTFSNTNATLHFTLITGLNEGQQYVYYVRCIDEYGNKNKYDFIVMFRVKKPDDNTPPKRSNQYPTGDVLAHNTNFTVIGISTDEPASCRYSLNQGTSFSSMSGRLSDDGTKRYHTATVTGLKNGQNYSYFVRCQDLEENTNTGDVMIFFSVRH